MRTLALALAATALTVWNGVAQADGGMRATPAPALLALTPISAPIVDHGEVLGQLDIRAMWKASDADALADTELRQPQLRAHLMAAAADHARLSASPTKAVDPRALAAEMQESARRAGFSGDLLVLEAVSRRAD